MRKAAVVAIGVGLSMLLATSASAHLAGATTIEAPMLSFKPDIDGDLSDWEDLAFTDGIWDIQRLQQQPYFGACSGIFDSGEEPEGTPETAADLSGEYFEAWDMDGIYLGVKTTDNVHDVTSSTGSSNDWWIKDTCAWYFDVLHDGDGVPYLVGDTTLSFIADDTYPVEGKAWDHGSADGFMQGDILPDDVIYAVSIDAVTGTNYVIEAFVPFASTLQAIGAEFQPAVGLTVGGGMIVHTDADGGDQDFGGQFCINSTGDDDGEWGDWLFAPGEEGPVTVESSSWGSVKALFK
jgi:hypothetical protein